MCSPWGGDTPNPRKPLTVFMSQTPATCSCNRSLQGSGDGIWGPESFIGQLLRHPQALPLDFHLESLGCLEYLLPQLTSFPLSAQALSRFIFTAPISASHRSVGNGSKAPGPEACPVPPKPPKAPNQPPPYPLTPLPPYPLTPLPPPPHPSAFRLSLRSRAFFVSACGGGRQVAALSP